MSSPNPNSAAIRPDGVAQKDGVQRGVPDSLDASQAYVSPDLKPLPMNIGVAGGQITASTSDATTIRDGVTPGPPATPQRTVLMLPTSFGMPGRPNSLETEGQRVHRLRAAGDPRYPSPAAKCGFSAEYVMPAAPTNGRTVE